MERRGVGEVAAPREEADVTHRLHKRFRIVEHRFVLESRELAISELPWRPDLDQLHLAAVFPAAVREPALHVRGPGDQHIAVPEANGLAKPTADVAAEIGYRALETELA